MLRIETAHGAALLTGDIGEVIERELVRRDRAALRAEVVLVAHHGSGGSSDPAFVAATGARQALVSSGYGNRFGHPRPDVVARWQQAGRRRPGTPRQAGAIRVLARGRRARAGNATPRTPAACGTPRRGRQARRLGYPIGRDRDGHGPED